MEIKLDIKKGRFEKEIIKEIARQILDSKKNRTHFRWNDPIDHILRNKALKLLKDDKEFDKELTADVRKQLKNKSLIKSIAEAQIKDKMRRYDD